MAFNNDQWQEAVVSLGNTGAAPPDTSTSGTVTNNNDAVTITLPGGQSTALIQITGTFVGTLNFEASPDSGTTYYSVQASVVGGSTLATTATAVGAWRCNISGFTNFRVRLSPVTSGTATIGIRLSAGVHNVFINNASALGQTTMANSAPVVLASDEIVPIKASFTEQATLTAGSLNADLVPATDVSAYKWFSLHLITLATGGAITFQGSNDGTNFSAVYAYRVDNPGSNVGGSTLASANAIYVAPIQFRYLRIRQTSWTSGSSTAVLELYSIPPAIVTAVLAAAQSGTWTVQPGNTANTTPWLTQGPSSSATAVANAGTGKAIKASAGALWSAVVTATGTAATTLYDNASAASGTALLTIPANASVGSVYSFPGGAPAANGMYADQVANAPSLTVYYR